MASNFEIQDMIKNIVVNYNGASFDQLKAMTGLDDESLDKKIGYLGRKQILKDYEADGKRFVRQIKGATPRINDIDCLWVLIDGCTYDDKFDYKAFSQIMPNKGGVSKIHSTFVKDDNCIINVMYVSPNTTMDTMLMQQRYFEINNISKDEEPSIKTVFYFVIRDLNTVKAVNDLKLRIPYIFAYVDYSESDIPIIDYIVPK